MAKHKFVPQWYMTTWGFKKIRNKPYYRASERRSCNRCKKLNLPCIVDPLTTVDDAGVFARSACKGCKVADEWCTAPTTYTDREIVGYHLQRKEAVERRDRWEMQTRKKKETEARKELKRKAKSGKKVSFAADTAEESDSDKEQARPEKKRTKTTQSKDAAIASFHPTPIEQLASNIAELSTQLGVIKAELNELKGFKGVIGELLGDFDAKKEADDAAFDTILASLDDDAKVKLELSKVVGNNHNTARTAMNNHFSQLQKYIVRESDNLKKDLRKILAEELAKVMPSTSKTAQAPTAPTVGAAVDARRALEDGSSFKFNFFPDRHASTAAAIASDDDDTPEVLPAKPKKATRRVRLVQESDDEAPPAPPKTPVSKSGAKMNMNALLGIESESSSSSVSSSSSGSDSESESSSDPGSIALSTDTDSEDDSDRVPNDDDDGQDDGHSSPEGSSNSKSPAEEENDDKENEQDELMDEDEAALEPEPSAELSTSKDVKSAEEAENNANLADISMETESSTEDKELGSAAPEDVVENEDAVDVAMASATPASVTVLLKPNVAPKLHVKVATKPVVEHSEEEELLNNPKPQYNNNKNHKKRRNTIVAAVPKAIEKTVETAETSEKPANDDNHAEEAGSNDGAEEAGTLKIFL